jgi:hypothetical protein
MVFHSNSEDVINWGADRHGDKGSWLSVRADQTRTIKRITARINVLGCTDHGKLFRSLPEHLNNLDCAVEDLSQRSSPSDLSAQDSSLALTSHQ